MILLTINSFYSNKYFLNDVYSFHIKCSHNFVVLMLKNMTVPIVLADPWIKFILLAIVMLESESKYSYSLTFYIIYISKNLLNSSFQWFPRVNILFEWHKYWRLLKGYCSWIFFSHASLYYSALFGRKRAFL